MLAFPNMLPFVDLKKELDSWCASAHEAIEAVLYENTVKNSKVIDSKLRLLVDALGQISEWTAVNYCWCLYGCQS